jgi:hypothetical protein
VEKKSRIGRKVGREGIPFQGNSICKGRGWELTGLAQEIVSTLV